MSKTRSWNRLLSLALCLCMVLGMIPGIPLSASAAGEAGSYVLVTDLNQILAGGQFVIVASSDGSAQALDTTIAGKIAAVAVTVENNAVTGDNLPVWTIEPTAGGVALSANGSYLGYKSSTNFASSTEAYEWGVEAGDTGFVLNSTSATRGIYYQISGNRFGAYAQSNASASDYVSQLQLYQYQGSGSSGDNGSLISIYFQNNWLWTDVKLHYWGSSSGTEWPGAAMELYGNDGTNDIYVLKVPSDITGLLINGTKNDGSGAMDQTPDITGGWFDGVLYSMTWADGNGVNTGSISDIEIVPPACQHQAQTIPGTAATCTADGLTEGSKCTLCGEILVAQETIPATGHSYDGGVCTSCGAADASNLRYIQVTSIADILSGGQFVIVANNGGTALALDTVTSGRITPVTVTLDGAIVTGDNLPVWTIEACGSGIALKSGEKYLVCKSSTSFSAGDTAHEWSVTAGDTGFIMNSASVTRGIYYQLSGNCFGAYATSNAANTGYISQLQLYKSRVVSGSCSHSYGEQVTKAPTCISEGVKTMICSLCGHSYTQSMPTVGHTEETVPGKASTCTTTGLSDGTKCSVCDQVLTAQEPLPTAPHSFKDGACTVCGTDSHMTIYFQSNWNWTNVNLYYWGSTSSENPNWPGTAMEYYGYDGAYSIYLLEVPTDITGMIFNGTAEDGSAAQTVDITGGWSDNALYSLVWIDGNHVNVGSISDIGLSCNHKAEAIPGTAATCTTDGLTEGSRCTLCDEILTAQEVIPATGHNYVSSYCTYCGTVNPDDCKYVLVTDIADILSGGEFVIVANNDGVAQALDTTTSGKIDPVTVTVENNVATGNSLPVWTIKATENGIALSVNGVYLGYVSSTNFASSDTAYEWGVKAGDNYSFVFNSTSATRGIYYQISTGRFGAYSTSNETSTSYISQLQLYKCRIATGSCAHSYSEQITTAPTCTTAGVKTFTCSLCGSSYTAPIAATGHTEETIPGTAATCTQTGLTDGSKCSLCGEILTVQEVIPVSAHSFDNGQCTVCGTASHMTIYFQNNWNWTDVNLYYWGSTIGENPNWPGTAMEYYGYDGTYDIYVLEVPTDITGMIFNDNTSQTTDITGGWSDDALYSLAWDGNGQVSVGNISDVTISCKHEAEILSGTAATCTTDGLTEGSKCRLCGEILTAQETIPATGHNYVNSFCTYCGEANPDDCKYVLVTDIADILSGGEFVIVANNDGVAQALDTTISGKITPVTVTVENNIATGNSLPVWTIEATENGIALKANGVYLGYVSSTNFVSSDTAYEWGVKAGDNYGFILSSTSTTRGIYYQISTGRFGAYSTSNETNTGYISQLQLYKYRVVTGGCVHSYSESITTAPTCTTTGVKTMTCGLCGSSYTETIPTVDHTKETLSGYAATCTEAGLTDGTKCAVCGTTLVAQETIPALGHSFKDGTCTLCGTASHMTIYFQSNWNWTNVNLYYWGSTSSENPSWPGTAMEYYGYDGAYSIYVLEVPTDITGMIFNGTAEDGSAAQTVDITGGWSDDALYSLVWNDGNYVNTGKISDIELAPSAPAEALKFSGATLTLNDDLTIKFKADQTLIESNGYTNVYAVFVLGDRTTVVRDYTIESGKYVFAFKNIAPYRMLDAVSATLYGTYNGVEYTSETAQYSVADYCYNMLSKYSSDTYAEFRTLLVDLLNYGEASQLYVGYNTSALVTANLTAAQKAWGTATDRTWKSVQNLEYTTITSPSVQWKGGGLVLKEAISMRFKISAASVEGLSVKVTESSGTETIITTFEATDDGNYYFYFNGLNAAQMSESVYLTVYKNGTAVSNTIRYSIESYAYAQRSSTSTTLVNLLKAMMKYGDAAKAYVS